jgi:hypothetical protein
MAPHPNTATVDPSAFFLARLSKILSPTLTDPRLFDDGAPGGGDSTPEETHLFKWRFLVDGNDGDVGHDRVLREGRSAHLVLG